MRSFRSVIATAVSQYWWIAVIVAVMACMHAVGTEGKPNTDAQPAADLSGPVACGSSSCGSGQLCVDQQMDGPDGSSDATDNYSCGNAPANCPLVQCSGVGGSGACPPCLALCEGDVVYDGQRTVTCYPF
jgi:hypothetical protein